MKKNFSCEFTLSGSNTIYRITNFNTHKETDVTQIFDAESFMQVIFEGLNESDIISSKNDIININAVKSKPKCLMNNE